MESRPVDLSIMDHGGLGGHGGPCSKVGGPPPFRHGILLGAGDRAVGSRLFIVTPEWITPSFRVKRGAKKMTDRRRDGGRIDDYYYY